MTDARIASLHLYPVKGCGGIAVTGATVAVTGLVGVGVGVGDREWMIVDPEGRFVTQREHPRLALVRIGTADGGLSLCAPNALPLHVAPASSSAREVVVWRSHVRGFDAGDPAAAWLSNWLGTAVRLVRFDRSRERPCNPEYAGDSGAHTLFADGYPVLVIGEGSLHELNERMAKYGEPALPMNRFRPNVVIAGLPPFAEDHVDTLRSGAVELTLVKPCVRCQVTTTDQDRGIVGIEPLRTLGECRFDERFVGVTFGMNAIVTAGAGSAIAVGAPVAVAYRF